MARDVNYRNFNNRRSFNNQPVKADEELVPIVVNDENRSYLMQHNLDWNNVETWHYPKPIPVAFVPNKRGNMELWMKWFHKEAKRYIMHSYNPESNDLSLDQFLDTLDDDDEKGFDPTGTTLDEDEAWALIVIKLLIKDLSDIDENMGAVFKLLTEDYIGKEILEKVDLGKSKSQGYEFITKTRKTAQELYEKYYR